ncbi:MAG: MATE family efflux transporter [Candidatus Riflebacteria bacterium]|nr:MATE family efflux transporter [Candidatus Riflebacteria bacterium]
MSENLKLENNSKPSVIDRTEALGNSSIKKLLIEYAGPAMIAMTASSLYNMVDSIFIGQGVGPLAISGLALTFPVMNLSAAFGAMVGVGASTLLSVKLGEGDKITAKRVLGNVINLNVLLGLVFMAVMLYYLDPILYFFGASNDTIGYAREYLQIILYGNVITHTYLGLNATLRSAGHPHKAMILTVVTVVLNCILDPIFIYPLKMGIAGAAWATVIAQSVPLISLIIHFCNKRELIHNNKDIFIPRWKIVREPIAIGLSPLSMQAAACCVVIIINKSLKYYGGNDGDLAIGAYGIITKLAMFCVMMIMGLNQGMQPIVGYNYGATKYDRVKQAYKYTVWIATLFTTLFFIIAEFFPYYAVKVFTNEPKLIDLSIYGLRTSSVFFPILGFQIVSTALFQSMGLAKTSIFLSLTRQFIFLIPFLIILPKYWGLTGVWFSLPASDITTCIITAYMVRRLFKKFKKKDSAKQ